MRTKFKIFYPMDHDSDKLKGKQYKPDAGYMVVMGAHGVFYLYDSEMYYPSITYLSDVLPKYDVVWSNIA